MSNVSLATDPASHLALVTGATGGIGKATCRALAKWGCSVAVHFNQNEDAATKLVEELKGLGVNAHEFKADLSGYEGVGPPSFLSLRVCDGCNSFLQLVKCGVEEL